MEDLKLANDLLQHLLRQRELEIVHLKEIIAAKEEEIQFLKASAVHERRGESFDESPPISEAPSPLVTPVSDPGFPFPQVLLPAPSLAQPIPSEVVVTSSDSQASPYEAESEWIGIDNMIQKILDPNSEEILERAPSTPTTYDIEDTMESIDGVLVPRKLTRIVKTASVEIAHIEDHHLNLEEKMLENLQDALSSKIGSNGQEEEGPESSDDEGDEEIALASPQIQRDSKAIIAERRSRLQSQPGSRATSQLMSNRASTAGQPPNWLIYNWISPKSSSLSKASLILQQLCKIANPLPEILFANQFEICRAVCKVIPLVEAEELSKHLIRTFEAAKLSLPLIEMMIKTEISETETNTTLFRSNTTSSKLLAAYSRMAGKQYLQNTLGQFIKQFKNFGSLEVDPEKLKDELELQVNMQKLTSASADLLNSIVQSIEDCPHSFRKICQVIHDNTTMKFPGRGTMAVGGFIFLRFFCPAIVAPEAFALMKKAPNQTERRSLVLVSKVVQNLANGVKFGAKEQYMKPVNDFIDQYTPTLIKFLNSLSVPPADPKEVHVTIPAAMVEESLVRLASIVEHHFEKISNEVDNGQVVESITHSVGDDLALVLRDFPLKPGQKEQIMNDFTVLSRFEDLLLGFNFSILTNLMRIVSNSSKETEQVSRASIQILAPRQSALPFVMKIVDIELKQAETPTKILDGMSMTFRLAAAYVHTFGASYLKKVLYEIIQEICQSQKGFEVDPHYLPVGENIWKNMDSLVMASYKCVATIVNSLSSCPGVIRKLCSEMYNRIRAKSDHKVAISVLTQVLFLRFFCPAIASPEAYALVDQVPSKKAHRALVLISYSLKHLASGTVFKDLYMATMNSFIRDHSELLQEFMGKICTMDEQRETILEPSLSFELRSQSLFTIRSLLTKENLAKLGFLFNQEAETETVTYKLTDRLAVVLADRYKQRGL